MGTTGSRLPGHGAYPDISSVRPLSGPGTPTSRVDTIANLNALSVARSEVGLEEFSESVMTQGRTWDGTVASNFLELWKDFAEGGNSLSFSPQELLQGLQALQAWSRQCSTAVEEGQEAAAEDVDAVEEAAARAVHGIANALVALQVEAARANAVLQLQDKVNEIEAKVEAICETQQAIMSRLQDHLPVSELEDDSGSRPPYP